MLISSLLPAVLLIGYVRYRDRRRPEPMMRIIQAVIYGLFSAFLAVPLAMALEGLVYSSGYGIFAVLPFVRGVFSAFVGAAIPEESMKLLMLWLMLRNCDDFDEAMDGIVYAVCIGMGFAGLENVLYVFQSEDGWATTALMRSLLAVPGHYIFAVLMGFFYSLAHFYPWLLYTSDAADDLPCVDLGGRRIATKNIRWMIRTALSVSRLLYYRDHI